MTGPISVAHLDTELTWRGGEQQVRYLVEGLLEHGHAPFLIAPPGSAIAERFRGDGLDVETVPMRGELDPLALWRLVRVLNRRCPDVVHMHTSHAHSLGVVASRLARVGRRVVSRRVDFVPTGLSAAVKYRVGVDRYLAITDAVRDVLIGAGVEPDRISLAPSGIDPARVEGGDGARARASWALGHDVPVVGTIAHFAWHKGLEYLVRAWPFVLADRPDARLVLVGRGEDEPKLRAEVERLGIGDRVAFAGFRDDVADVLAGFDVFALPSVMEGLGTSILDALAAHRPVVASRVGGIPEIIRDGETGLLVEPRDSDGLGRALGRLLSDPELRRSLARAGRQRVLERFTARAMVTATLAAYTDVLRRS